MILRASLCTAALLLVSGEIFASTAIDFASRLRLLPAKGSQSTVFSIGSEGQRVAVLQPIPVAALPIVRSRAVVASSESARLSVQAGYGLSSDFAQVESPRLFQHRLGISGSVEMGASSGSIGLGMTWRTLNQEVDATTNSGAVAVSDIEMSGAHTLNLGEGFGGRHKAPVSVGVSWPLSEASRFEGIRGIPFASIGTTSEFRDGRVSLGQALSMAYIINSFDRSPVSREVNSDWSVTYGLNGRVRVWRKLALGFGGSLKSTRAMDGSWVQTVSFNSSQSLSYQFSSVTVALAHNNGQHIEDRTMSEWYFNAYRRLVTLSVSGSWP